MSTLSEILEHNARFVKNREYEAFLTDKFPTKKLVVVTCMDTRLVELLPKAMNLRNGDVKMIKVAGAVISHPFGSVMRSIFVAVYGLDANEIAIVGHRGCGIVDLDSRQLLQKALDGGVAPEVIQTLRHAGVNLEDWLTGFASVEDGVRRSVELVRAHPLLPRNLPVHGMVMDSQTGAIDVITEGYQAASHSPR